jgi:uncharacterized membrane-anchored protein YhcB (DUF1043 family)
MDNQIILFAATLLTAVLGIIIGAVAYSYKKLITKYYVLKDEIERRDAQSKQYSDQVLKEAQARASIINQNAESYQAILKRQMDEQITLASQNYQAAYQQIIDTLKNESIKSIQNISNDIKTDMNSEIKNVLTSLQDEMVRTQTSAIATLKQGLAKSEEDIKLYKQEMYKKIDQSILLIIQNVSYKVIGKAINLEDHEDLVLNALTSAKRQGII